MRDLIKHDALLWLVVFNSSDWCILILADHPVICSLGSLLSHSSPVVVFFDHGHQCFWNFYSTIPVDVVRVESYVNCLIDPMCVVIRVITLLCSRVACVRCCGHALNQQRSRHRPRWMSQSCSLILSCIGLPVSPTYTLPHSQGIL